MESNKDNNSTYTTEEKLNKYNTIKSNLEKFYKKYDKEPRKLSLTAKMATVSAALKREFDDLKFVGFYVVEQNKKEYLEIGPYVSDIIATPIIDFGKGVCGSSYSEKKTLIENDISVCNNYIACDEETKSEIVLPIFSKKNNDEVIAVWDIDSIVLNRFDVVDQENIMFIINNYL
jgi:GAF domain-containing protein